MKHIILVFACLVLPFLNTSCKKSRQIHLISAHNWIVTDISTTSNFAQIGDELTFFDNRLFFNHSNGVKADGQWNFPTKDIVSEPIQFYDTEALVVTSNFRSYEFTIVNLTTKVLEIHSTYSGEGTIRMEAKD